MVTSAPVLSVSRRAHPGRQYQPLAEAHIHELLPALARSLPGAARHGTVMVRECPGPYGVADLVVQVGGQRQLDRRLSAGLPPLLSEIDASIVAQLRPGQPTALSDLALSVGRSVGSVKRRLGRLRGLDAVADRPTGYVRHPALDLGGSLHALEAKTSDWGRGIDQALGYAVWADTATLVVGRLPRNPEPAMRRAHRLRLGLVGGTCWLRRPSRRAHGGPIRHWAMEHLVAALLGYQPSSAM